MTTMCPICGNWKESDASKCEQCRTSDDEASELINEAEMMGAEIRGQSDHMEIEPRLILCASPGSPRSVQAQLPGAMGTWQFESVAELAAFIRGFFA